MYGNWEELKVLDSLLEESIVNMENHHKNLIPLSNKTLPLINKLLGPFDNHEWIDFCFTFWHCKKIVKGPFENFNIRYEKFCKKYGYPYSIEKSKRIYESYPNIITDFDDTPVVRRIIKISIKRYNNSVKEVKEFSDLLIEIARQNPEFECVWSLTGVQNDLLASRLIAEIGDVRRFENSNLFLINFGIHSNRKQNLSELKEREPILADLLQEIVEKIIRESIDGSVYTVMIEKRLAGFPSEVCAFEGIKQFLINYYNEVRFYLEHSS